MTISRQEDGENESGENERLAKGVSFTLDPGSPCATISRTALLTFAIQACTASAKQSTGAVKRQAMR